MVKAGTSCVTDCVIVLKTTWQAQALARSVSQIYNHSQTFNVGLANQRARLYHCTLLLNNIPWEGEGGREMLLDLF